MAQTGLRPALDAPTRAEPDGIKTPGRMTFPDRLIEVEHCEFPLLKNSPLGLPITLTPLRSKQTDLSQESARVARRNSDLVSCPANLRFTWKNPLDSLVRRSVR